MAHVNIRQALQFVADHPEPATDVMLDLPVWELVSRELFYIANNPNVKVRGSMAKSTRAQKMILDRLVGTRRNGTNPVSTKIDTIDFVDLTQGVITV